MITEEAFLKRIQPVNLQIGKDGLTLFYRLRRSGFCLPGRVEKLRYGTRDFRLIAGLYALASTLFQQTTANDAQAFDLYDALREAWPFKELESSPEFLELHSLWRKEHPFRAPLVETMPDMLSHRRVSEFYQQCE